MSYKDELWTLLTRIENEADDNRRTCMTERNITLAEGNLATARRVKHWMVIKGYKTKRVKP